MISHIQVAIIVLFNFVFFLIIMKTISIYINHQTSFNLTFAKTFERLVKFIENSAEEEKNK